MGEWASSGPGVPAWDRLDEEATVDVVGWPVAVASLSLVALAVGLALWLRLGIAGEVVLATARAAVQLLAVGAVFAAIFASPGAMRWSVLWAVLMVAVATAVVRRRAGLRIPGLLPATGLAVAGSALVSLLVVFGFGVFDLEPVAFVVIAGITVGNAVPSASLGVARARDLCREAVGEIEAALALGFDRAKLVRFVAPRAARTAMIPQVERTKVVGLIALPGAMTGLLLAGVAPVEAVVVQLLVMYLVLGTAALCVVTVVATVVRAAVTTDLRVAGWTAQGSEGERSRR